VEILQWQLMLWYKRILDFYTDHRIGVTIPDGVEILYPFDDVDTRLAMTAFYSQFYNDASSRTMMIGINPGRFGAGVTGVPFTDPIRLQEVLGIENSFATKAELSSIYMYQMIEAFGGPRKFFNTFYITSVSPIGYVRDGKNLNYYDDTALQHALKPYMIKAMQTQLQWPVNRSVAYCLGEGKNYAFLKQLNDQEKWFDCIEPLPHPRFIMQYKRRFTADYVQQYMAAFQQHGLYQ
jgi:hypothetical protein